MFLPDLRIEVDCKRKGLTHQERILSIEKTHFLKGLSSAKSKGIYEKRKWTKNINPFKDRYQYIQKVLTFSIREVQRLSRQPYDKHFTTISLTTKDIIILSNYLPVDIIFTCTVGDAFCCNFSPLDRKNNDQTSHEYCLPRCYLNIPNALACISVKIYYSWN